MLLPVLSGDPTLIEDYLNGDPYRRFAKASLGILNPTEQQRQVYKAVVLGRIYGQGASSLARNLGISTRSGSADHRSDECTLSRTECLA